MEKYSVVGTEVPKVMRHVASCTKGKHLGMHVQSKLQQFQRANNLALLRDIVISPCCEIIHSHPNLSSFCRATQLKVPHGILEIKLHFYYRMRARCGHLHLPRDPLY